MEPAPPSDVSSVVPFQAPGQWDHVSHVATTNGLQSGEKRAGVPMNVGGMSLQPFKGFPSPAAVQPRIRMTCKKTRSRLLGATGANQSGQPRSESSAEQEERRRRGEERRRNSPEEVPRIFSRAGGEEEEGE